MPPYVVDQVLRAGQVVCSTTSINVEEDEEVERWLAEAEREVELDQQEKELLARIHLRVSRSLQRCVKARMAKDEEIKELEQKLKACEDRLLPQSNQMQQILRRKSVDDLELRKLRQSVAETDKGRIQDEADQEREAMNLNAAVREDLNKYLVEQRRRSQSMLRP
jgi:hypothetical protein